MKTHAHAHTDYARYKLRENYKYQ